jgi:hypothetical protein
MKTHELAEGLLVLAKSLKAAPNVDVSDLKEGLRIGSAVPSRASIAVNLATLAALSKIDKREWMAVVHEYQLPLEIRQRDASRDILGKLLSHLDSHPEEIEHLRRRAYAKPADASPELMKALSILLRDQDRG